MYVQCQQKSSTAAVCHSMSVYEVTILIRSHLPQHIVHIYTVLQTVHDLS